MSIGIESKQLEDYQFDLSRPTLDQSFWIYAMGLIMSSLLLIMLVSRGKGLGIAIVFLSLIISNLALIRLTEKIITVELLVAFAGVILWFLIAVLWFVVESNCVHKQQQLSAIKAFRIAFHLERRVFRRLIGVLLMAGFILLALSGLTTDRFSQSFNDSLLFFSIITSLLYSLWVFTLSE
jgi:hypothetical protein